MAIVAIDGYVTEGYSRWTYACDGGYNRTLYGNRNHEGFGGLGEERYRNALSAFTPIVSLVRRIASEDCNCIIIYS